MIKLPPDRIRRWIETNFDHDSRKDDTEYCINNPFDGDTDKKFNINVVKGVCHYWRGDSGWAGPPSPRTGKHNCSFIHFVQLYLNCNQATALKAIMGQGANLSDFRGEQAEEPPPDLPPLTLPEGSLPLVTSADLSAQMVRNYLKRRGVDTGKLDRYRIHHCGMEVVWPYYEFEQLVYWQSRSCLNKRFLFPPLEVGVSKGEFLYGFDLVEPASYLVLTEAIFDAMTLQRQTLASGGAALTELQVRKLRLLGPKQVILAPDNDIPGIKSILDNYKLLDGHGYKLFYSLPPELPYEVKGEHKVTKDWNELGQHVVGFAQVFAAMDKAIRPLTRSELLGLQRRCQRKQVLW